jgi:hypothetical protein
LACLLFLLSAGAAAVAQPTATAPSSAKAPGNSMGMFLSGSKLGESVRKNLLTNTFRVAYYRPAPIFLDKFATTGEAPDCDFGIAAGLKLVLVVRANGSDYKFSDTPKDMDDYKKSLAAVLDKYKDSIALLVIENEPDNSFVGWNGDVKEYLDLLKAAAEVAAQYNIKVADGGLSSKTVLMTVADSYVKANAPDKAVALLHRATGADITDQSMRAMLAKRAREIAFAKEMLAGCKATGAAFCNFHWYERDAAALSEVVAFLNKASGLPVVTDEIGQATDDGKETNEKLNALVKLRLPYTVWYSADGVQAHSLVDTDGKLRDTGQSFQTIVGKP